MFPRIPIGGSPARLEVRPEAKATLTKEQLKAQPRHHSDMKHNFVHIISTMPLVADNFVGLISSVPRKHRFVIVLSRTHACPRRA